jgi:hypothetical protein
VITKEGVLNMKITNNEIIRNGEQELIDSINGDLDWEAMEEIFLKEHKLGIGEDVEYKKGDIVVHNNQVAYRLEFDIKVKLSILLDRQGDYISFSTVEEAGATQEKSDSK